MKLAWSEKEVRESISHLPSRKIGNIFCFNRYKEPFLREVWDYFDLNSKYWMRDYKFSLEFLREMNDRMNLEFWYEIICMNDVYTNKEKREMVKEFKLPFVFEVNENEWYEIISDF